LVTQLQSKVATRPQKSSQSTGSQPARDSVQREWDGDWKKEREKRKSEREMQTKL